LRNKLFFILALCLLTTACSKPKTPPVVDEGPIRKIHEALAKGNYTEALNSAKEISSQDPPGPYVEPALYLQSYVLAYGKTDFQGVRLPIKQLLIFTPKAGSPWRPRSCSRTANIGREITIMP